VNFREGLTPLNVALASLAMVGLWVLAVADPATSPIFPPCMWREATGFLCPGCGAARAIHALMNGQIREALRYNPFAIAALPLGATHLLLRFGAAEEVWTRLRPKYIHALATAVILFGVLRNIPS